MIARSSEVRSGIGRPEDASRRLGEGHLPRLGTRLLVDFGPELPRMLQLRHAAHREEDWLVQYSLFILLHILNIWVCYPLSTLPTVLLLYLQLLLCC